VHLVITNEAYADLAVGLRGITTALPSLASGHVKELRSAVKACIDAGPEDALEVRLRQYWHT
jgi:hypothetical protein